MAIRIEINSCILSLILSLTDIFPQEQCLHRGSIGGVECTLNGSSLSSTVNVEVMWMVYPYHRVATGTRFLYPSEL